MRLEVKYHQRLFRPCFGVIGPGVLHVLETAVYIEGFFPRFHVFAARTSIVRKLVCDKSTRTVPYSRIIEHRAPHTPSGKHWLRIHLADGKKRWLGFSTLPSQSHRVKEILAENREIAERMLGG